MAVARISRLEFTGNIPPTKRARVSQLALTGTVVAGASKRARISRLGLTGSYSSRRARISELRFTGSTVQPLVPSLTASPVKAEPGATVTVSAAATTGNGVSTVWSLASGGAGVILTGTGLTRTLVAPRDYQGRSIVVQVNYQDEYGVTETRSVTVTVYPQQLWFCRPSGELTPVTHAFLRV